MQEILAQLRREGMDVLEEDVARLTPLVHEHVNMLGRYDFTLPEAITQGKLRTLRDPRTLEAYLEGIEL